MNKKDLTYTSYLKVNELLDLQKPLSSPVAHDELLFIVIHQVYELWFKQVLFELDKLIIHLGEENHIAAFRNLNRVATIFKTLVQQVDILETMTPVDFNKFRAHLNPASGFQSLQFRELELVAGADKSEYDKFSELQPEWKTKLTERLAKKNLRQAFIELLQKNNLLKESTPEALVNSVQQIYSDADKGLYRDLCESLIGFDELIQLWRFRHVQMVERMIGMKRGTGGSLGVAYLQSTLKKKFFPELWQARTQMGGDEAY